MLEPQMILAQEFLLIFYPELYMLLSVLQSILVLCQESYSIFLLLLPYLNGLIPGEIFPKDAVGRRFSIETNAWGIPDTDDTSDVIPGDYGERSFAAMHCGSWAQLTSQNGAFHKAGRVCGFDGIFVIFDPSEYKFSRWN